MTGSSQKALLLWLTGGAGVVLLYAALKNKKAKDILSASMSSGPLTTGAGSTAPANSSTSAPAPVPAVPPLPDIGQPSVVDKNGFTVGVPSAYGNGAGYIPPENYV